MKTPEEKAAQLVDFYSILLPLYDNGPHSAEIAKCGHKAVDEIIESRKEDKHFDDRNSSDSEYYSPHPLYITYWLKVKSEITRLCEN